MKVRSELLVTCAALVLCAVTPVRAADLVTKAPAVAPTTWWYEGYAEIGGRFDMNDPDKSKLGRFYKYEDLRPGVFGNFYYGQHRTGPDPWDLAFWGTNAGWDDQAFGLDMAKPGTYYLTFGWDETPHVYSKGARTTYSPIGGTVLTTPCYPTGAGNVCGGGLANANTNAFVNANAVMFDLGFRRDTASAGARWTPDDNWDVTANYSHMHREGTQPGSMVAFTAGAKSSIQLAKPVDDTTQNANVKAEYAGSSPWGKPFNVALGYALSLYDDSLNSVTFNNPWLDPTAALGTNNSLLNRYSLWPDNSAHTLNVTGGAGLPLNSRYMGTFQYTWMNQDEAFLPSTINPNATAAILPISSVGGAHTLLSNNVINTQILPDLSSTLRYRYYDYHTNQAPVTITGLVSDPDTNAATTSAITRPVNFTKQNASAQLDWKPWRWLNTGAAYEFERSAQEIQGVDVVTGLDSGAGFFDVVTNENAVKAFADTKLWSWSTLRTSIRYGERRLDSDYVNALAGASNRTGFRTPDLQNRNSTDVKAQWNLEVVPSVTVTPTGGYRLDDYDTNGITAYGVRLYEAWNAGGDVSWVINPMATLYVSYIHEDGRRDLYNSNQSAAVGGLPANLDMLTRDHADTIVVGTKITAIPETLFITANYTFTRSTSQWTSNCGPTGACVSFGANPWPTFPDTHNTNHRIDAQAKYMLDKSLLRNAGLLPTAQPYVKFRMIYEHNSTDTWQNVEQLTGWAVNPADTSNTNRAVFLGLPNPNYDIVVGMVSLGLKW